MMPFSFSTVLHGVNVESDSDSSEFLIFLQSRPRVEIRAAVRLKTTVRWSRHQVAQKQMNAEKARMAGVGSVQANTDSCLPVKGSSSLDILNSENNS